MTKLLGHYVGHADNTQNTVFCLFEPDAPGMTADAFPSERSVFFGTRPGKRYPFLPSMSGMTEEQAIKAITLRRVEETGGAPPDMDAIKRIVWEYKNAPDGDGVAKLMVELAGRFPLKPGAEAGTPVLPVMADLNQAIGVGAADARAALALVVPEGGAPELETRLSTLAFEEGIAGRTYIARLTADEWLEAKQEGVVKDATLETGVFFIAPEYFGIGGTVWNEIPADATLDELRTELAASLDRFHKEWRKLDRKSHAKLGTEQLISWTEYDPDMAGVVKIGEGSKKLGGPKLPGR